MYNISLILNYLFSTLEVNSQNETRVFFLSVKRLVAAAIAV